MSACDTRDAMSCRVVPSPQSKSHVWHASRPVAFRRSASAAAERDADGPPAPVPRKMSSMPVNSRSSRGRRFRGWNGSVV